MITETQSVQFDSIALDCGVTLAPVDVAYETYGELNAARSNAILILHAFTGDAHAAGTDKITGAVGWWDNMIGPGKGFDTDKYFVICSNVLSGCRGTSGPGSINPETGCPYAMSFPPVTIPDMVRLQKMLVEHLGIERLLAVAGGSMGAMQALQWACGLSGCRGGGAFRSPAPRGTARSRSRSTKWAGRPSWRTRIGTKATTTASSSRARTGGGAHGGAHHLHERHFHAREIRPPPARSGSVRSRKLFALSRQSVRRPLRREFVPLHHQGDGLLRSHRRGRPR